MCREFYSKFAIQYIYKNSRLKDEDAKLTHQRYIHRFLEGIENPADFYYLKIKDPKGEWKLNY